MDAPFSLENSRVYLAGHTGLVGGGLKRRLEKVKGIRMITAKRSELDLTDCPQVERFIAGNKPAVVIIAAGRVGGIGANSAYPAEFIYQNLMIQTNLIHASWKAGVKRLLNFGSGCMYPADCPQPMVPEQLLTAKLESTSQPYAMAKLAGMEMCAAYNRQHGTHYINAIPASVYGPGDHFEPDRSHVMGALIRKFHEARLNSLSEVVLWGTGKPVRQFVYVDDLAEACLLLLEKYNGNGPVNIGGGEGCSVAELASLIAEVVGYQGKVVWDPSKPDGAPKKVLDCKIIQRMGWPPPTDLKRGLKQTYEWYRAQKGA